MSFTALPEGQVPGFCEPYHAGMPRGQKGQKLEAAIRTPEKFVHFQKDQVHCKTRRCVAMPMNSRVKSMAAS